MEQVGEEDMLISSLSPAEITRYVRHLALEGWGREAQERVKSSRALIVGAGGLGSTAALQLMAAGVGALRLVDNSRINLADLGQQVLFREQDLGKAKAAAAEQRLKDLNSFTQVESLVKILSLHNVSRLTSDCQVLVDATNNSPAGLILNQAAAKFHLPLVAARVWNLDGCLTTYWPGHGPCLTCSHQEIDNSGTPALLSPLPGILGTLQALEALRILGGLGAALLGRLIHFHGSSFHFTEKPLQLNSRCPTCQTSRNS
jgi:molybdopterin/thiamine biosynthesis adenylyltransferase